MGPKPPETSGDLSKVTQLISGRVGARTRNWSRDFSTILHLHLRIRSGKGSG